MRVLLLAFLLLAGVTQAGDYSCNRTDRADGFTLDCKAAAVVTVIPNPPPPPPPPPPPVSGNVEGVWDWALMGEDHRQVFAANRLYTFAIAVPNGYAGTLELKAGEVPGSPRFEPSMSLWISETPGGAPVPRTLALINRPWSTGGPQTVTHPNPVAGRTYYLNFKVSQGGAYLLRINHQ